MIREDNNTLYHLSGFSGLYKQDDHALLIIHTMIIMKSSLATGNATKHQYIQKNPSITSFNNCANSDGDYIEVFSMSPTSQLLKC